MRRSKSFQRNCMKRRDQAMRGSVKLEGGGSLNPKPTWAKWHQVRWKTTTALRGESPGL